MNIRLFPALAPLLAASIVNCASHAHARPEPRPEAAVAALARTGRTASPERVRWSKVRSEKLRRSFFFSSYDSDSGLGDLWMLDEASGQPTLLGEGVSFHLTLTKEGRLFFVGAVAPDGTGELVSARLPEGLAMPVDQHVSRFGLELDAGEGAGVYLSRLSAGGRGELKVLSLGTMRSFALAEEVTDFRVTEDGERVLFVDHARGSERGLLHEAPLPLAAPISDLGATQGSRVPSRVVAAR
ncbi:MAG TPA: hypothetical protein VFE30_15780 [Anaeromyxobacteraceae bacterium]|jgi:hypothetical protein|nr:hypothetical protein [Anaeromyxobacteraceae bacterium]